MPPNQSDGGLLDLILPIAILLYPLTVLLVASGLLPVERKNPFSKAAKIVAHYFSLGVALSGALIGVTALLAIIYILGYLIFFKIGIISFPMGTILKPAFVVLITIHIAIQVGTYAFVLKKADCLD